MAAVQLTKTVRSVAIVIQFILTSTREELAHFSTRGIGMAIMPLCQAVIGYLM